MVVVSFIGLITVLLLPAVQSAREAARRAQCTQNLRQIGIALHSYADTIGCFPLGTMLSGDPRFPGKGRPYCEYLVIDKGFLASILPQIEQASLFNSINHGLSLFSRENHTVLAVRVATYSCPSDPDAGRLRDGSLVNFLPFIPKGFDSHVKVATTSYACMHGPNTAMALPVLNGSTCIPPPDRVESVSGTIIEAGPIRPVSVSDGLSNTIIATEKATSSYRAFDAIVPNSTSQTAWWASGSFGDTLSTALYPPNSYKITALDADTMWIWFASASSQHPGGVNALLGDGSVRFIKETIDSWPVETAGHSPSPRLWQALSTRNGGELASPGDY